jgi:hypothetical protein
MRNIENNRTIIDELSERFSAGKKVRLRVKKSVFAKGGTGHFSEEVYTVKEYIPPARIRVVDAEGLTKVVPVRDALVVVEKPVLTSTGGKLRERKKLQRGRMIEQKVCSLILPEFSVASVNILFGR